MGGIITWYKLSKYDKLWVVSSCFTNRQTTLPSTELLRGAGSTPRCAAAGAAKLPHRWPRWEIPSVSEHGAHQPKRHLNTIFNELFNMYIYIYIFNYIIYIYMFLMGARIILGQPIFRRSHIKLGWSKHETWWGFSDVGEIQASHGLKSYLPFYRCNVMAIPSDHFQINPWRNSGWLPTQQFK